MHNNAKRPVRVLGIERAGTPAIWEDFEDDPGPGHFWVQTLYSGISAGTELTYVKGTNPYLHSAWDPALGVFRADQPATGYPIRQLGYMEVGRVIDSQTTAVTAGDLIASSYGHRTGRRIDAGQDRFVVLPPDIDPLLGVYVAHMGPICANGLLHAAAEVLGREVLSLGDGVRGRNVVVVGAGVVGLLTALFARHHGAAEVVVVDETTARLDAAEKLGLGSLLEENGRAWLSLKQRWRHGAADCGADVVFQCRGQVRALASAMRMLRPQGTVIDLAFYQGGANELNLGEEFHHNGLALRCAQIGRVPRGLDHLWSRTRLAHETIELVQSHGESIRRALISDVISFDEGPRLLTEMAECKKSILQAVLEIS